MVDIHRHLPGNRESTIPPSWHIWYATSSPDEWETLRQLEITETQRRGYGILPKVTVEIDSVIRRLNDLIASDPYGYIGEFGLDYRYEPTVSRKIQFSLALELLRLARNLNRPAVLHHVGPMNQLEQLLNKAPGTTPVIIHGFLKSVESARKLADLGATISLGPNVWKKKTKLGKRLAEIDIPFLLETDFNLERERQMETGSYEQIVTEHTEQVAKRMERPLEEIKEMCHGYAKVFENW